jgi:CheY-like chemotaxis protein
MARETAELPVGAKGNAAASLPLHELPGDPKEPSAQKSSPPSSGRRILIVDDRADSAKSMAMLLTMKGHQVRTAHDGPTALQIVHDFEPDVVLLDIGLPGMSGYEVAQHLRREQGPKELLLVAFTGYGQPEDRRRSKEAGFNFHLVKPVSTATLMHVLKLGI